MKKTLLFVLAAIFACYTMNAQIFINEGFENGIPNTWTTIDNDGDGNNWSDGATILPTWDDDAADYCNSGSNMAMSMSYDNATYTSYNSDNYLITPQVTIPASGATLTFYARSIGGTTYPDSYSVKLSTTGNAVADFTVELQAAANAPAAWTMSTIDLAAYAGQQVYIAFDHQTNDQLALMIDDVKLYSFTTTPEISLNSVVLPYYAYAGEGFEVGGVVLNVSQNPLTSFNVTYNVDGGSESTSFSVTGISVASGETYEFTHNVQAIIPTGGDHTVNVTVSNPNGVADNTADNTASATISVFDCSTAITEFPYEEGFESGVIESCWRATQSAEGAWDNAYPYIQQYGSYYPDQLVVRSGINSLISLGDVGAENWLISPAITIPANATSANFKFYDLLSIDMESAGSADYSVLVSTTGMGHEDFTSLNDFSTNQNEFTLRTVDLSAYAGQTIYVAIQHVCNAWLIVDDFSIEVELDPNVTAYNVTVVSDNSAMGTVTGGGSFVGGATTTISAVPNSGYRFVRWNDNNTDNPRTITVSADITYTAYFEQIPTTGINDVNAADVKLFPNPTSGNLYVEVEGLQKVEIIDAVGRVVLSQNNGTVNMSALANGIYTVRVSANGTTSIKKVVKK